MARTLFCFGYGFSARALGARMLTDGGRVIATARDATKAEALRDEGVEAHEWPLPDLSMLPEGASVLVSAPPGPEGDPVLARHAAALPGRGIGWLGYLSTTAVYGDHGGGEVDEDTPATPGSARGRARLDAENDWLALVPAVPVHVFRLAGIYGPGRGPLEKVREADARRIVKPGQVFGRIHREDIADACLASMARPDPGAIYNLTDDHTCPPEEALAYAARIQDLPVPPLVPFEEADLSPMARSFYAECKRVSNEKAKRALGWVPRYPSYREGFAADLEARG